MKRVPHGKQQRWPLAVVTLVAVSLLSACDVLNPPSQEPDSINLEITGLPSDVTTSVSVTGPNGFMEVLYASELLTQLEPGEYTIHSSPKEIMGTTFTAQENRITLELEAGGAIEHTVAYAPHRDIGQASVETLNELRTALGLEPVTLDIEGSLPHWLHARYVAENRVGGHTQDPDLPWATPEGAQAAAISNVSHLGGKPRAKDWPTATYLNAPFHLFSLLHPKTHALRVGVYHSETQDRSATVVQAISNERWPADTTVTFPRDPYTLTVHTYDGGEWPSPTTPCPGYTTNERAGNEGGQAGTPIFALYGPDNTPTIYDVQLTQNGQQVEHCYYTSAEYYNPNEGAQESARAILQVYGGVIIVPEYGLEPNSSYQVSIRHSEGETEWQFSTGEQKSQYWIE